MYSNYFYNCENCPAANFYDEDTDTAQALYSFLYSNKPEKQIVRGVEVETGTLLAEVRREFTNKADKLAPPKAFEEFPTGSNVYYEDNLTTDYEVEMTPATTLENKVENQTTEIDNEMADATVTLEVIDNVYFCFTCEKQFATKNFLARHYQSMVHKNKLKNVPVKILSTNNSDPATATVDDQQLTGNQCEICGKVCGGPNYLKQHMRTHTLGNKFKCKTCGKRFSKMDEHNLHVQKHLQGDKAKPYKCNECPRRFVHKSDLTRHSLAHGEQLPYECNVCNKGFLRQDHMISHRKIHQRRKNMENNSV